MRRAGSELFGQGSAELLPLLALCNGGSRTLATNEKLNTFASTSFAHQCSRASLASHLRSTPNARASTVARSLGAAACSMRGMAAALRILRNRSPRLRAGSNTSDRAAVNAVQHVRGHGQRRWRVRAAAVARQVQAAVRDKQAQQPSSSAAPWQF